MPSAYDTMSKQTLRATFKREHFDLSTTNFDLLFKQYHATNMFYRNTENYYDLCWDSQEFYKIYQDEVLNRINNDKKYMLSVELKNCRDLIYLEYIQKSPKFNKAYADTYARLKQMVQKYQQHLKTFGLPDYRSRNMFSCGEACFILYLHPEFAETVGYMMCNGLTPQMHDAINKGNSAKQYTEQKTQRTRAINPRNIVIRQSWQVGKIK